VLNQSQPLNLFFQTSAKTAQKLSETLLPLLPQAMELVQQPEFTSTMLAILDSLVINTRGKFLSLKSGKGFVIHFHL